MYHPDPTTRSSEDTSRPRKKALLFLLSLLALACLLYSLHGLVYAYADKRGRADLITDAPWRLDADRNELPLLVAAFDPAAPCDVRVSAPDGTGGWNLIYHESKDSQKIPPGVRILDPTGIVDNDWGKVGNVDCEKRPNVYKESTYHFIILLPKSELSTQKCGNHECAFLKTEVRFWTPSDLRLHRYSRVLRVFIHKQRLPRWFEGDHYYDPHTHTIAEWIVLKTGLYRKNLGGPIEMMKQSAYAMGFLDDPEHFRDRLVTTDHTFFYADAPVPPFGARRIARGSGDEFAAYKQLFGSTTGQEIYVDVGAPFTRHMLGYRLDELLEGFQFTNLPGESEPAAIGRRTPKLTEAIQAVRDDRDAFSFAAHPLPANSKKLSLQWPHASIKRALSYDGEHTFVRNKSEFVFNGLQWWNQRICNEREWISHDMLEVTSRGV